MQKKIELNSLAQLPLSPLEKDQQGVFAVPTMRCGVLPCYIDKENQILWGCVESNRVGTVTITPPAGIQDIIVIKEELYISLEVGKPFPDLKIEFLAPYIGKLFRDQPYQEIIACLLANTFKVYVENPLETALHETYEEHGIDLRKEGKDHHLLNTLIECPVRKLSGKQGATAQYTCIAFLKNTDHVKLNDTSKIENKIRRNFGRSFNEKGCWGTVASFKMTLAMQRDIFNPTDQKARYTKDEADLIEGALTSFEDAIKFLEDTEVLIRQHLTTPNIQNSEQGISKRYGLLNAQSFFTPHTRPQAESLKDHEKLTQEFT